MQVQTTSAWVTKTSYTRDEALVDKVRAAGAWERGEISSRTLAAIKANITRRTNAGVSTKVVAAPALAPARGAAVELIRSKTDNVGDEIVNTIVQATAEAVEQAVADMLKGALGWLEEYRSASAAAGKFEPANEVFLTREKQGAPGAVQRAQNKADWISHGLYHHQQDGRVLGIAGNAATQIERAIRSSFEKTRQNMISKYLEKVLTIVSRGGFAGIKNVSNVYHKLDGLQGCCFEFHFEDGARFEAQTLVVEVGYGRAAFFRYPLTFHEAFRGDGSKIERPSLSSVTEALGGSRVTDALTMVMQAVPNVSREGITRLLVLARTRNPEARDTARRALSDEKRYHGGWVRSAKEAKHFAGEKWFRGTYADRDALIEQDAERASIAFRAFFEGRP